MLKILKNASKLKEYVNDFKIPKRYTGVYNSEEHQKKDSDLEKGKGLAKLGEYFFMAFALIPKAESDKVFDKIEKMSLHEDNAPEQHTLISIHSTSIDLDLVMIISDSNDELIHQAATTFKKYNHLPYSDEVSIQSDGLFDNDGCLTGMNLELTLGLLDTQKFFKPTPLNDLSTHQVCFTGFRDKHCEAQLSKAKAKIVPSVTKNTTILVVKEPGLGSSKESKAEELSIPVVSMFQLVTEYLHPKSV